MKIIRLDDSTPGPKAILDQSPLPQAGHDELLIQVYAAGVIPAELLWYPTWHTKSGDKRIRPIPSHEFSGVVSAVGSGASGLSVGQEVFGMNDWFSDGAMAEYCVAPFSAVALKPPRLSHAEAASAPISALTAWQGLIDRAKIQPGERVLVHGGAGSVGVFAVQLARLQGAHVTATASHANLEFVKSLGAEQVVDYAAVSFDRVVTDVDVVFDTVGGETLQRSWNILGPHGRLVTTVSEAENATDARTKEAFFIVEPNGKQLTAIAELLQSGKLRPVVDSVIPLSQAPDAYARRTPRQGRGKVVVTVI